MSLAFNWNPYELPATYFVLVAIVAAVWFLVAKNDNSRS